MVPAHDNPVIEAADLLRVWLTHRDKTYGTDGERPVFCTWNGNPLHPRFVNRILDAAVRRTTITKRVWIHGFRHARITHLRAMGIPDGDIEYLGWVPGTPMMCRYYHPGLSRP